MNYLQKNTNYADPEFGSIFDELSLWSSYFVKLLLENIDLKSHQKILDVGCGTGVPILELAQRLGDSCQLVGMDTWKAALERLCWKIKVYGLKNVGTEFGDAIEMPFEKEVFDRIVSNVGINNFEHPKKVVAECHRVLVPGGKISLTTNLTGHYREFYHIYENALKELGMTELLPALKVQEEHRGTVESVRELLEEGGFSILKIVKGRFQWRYLNGSTLLRHSLTIFGFLEGWRSILRNEEEEKLVFSKIESLLNAQAEWEGDLRMTVPMLYVEGVKR